MASVCSIEALERRWLLAGITVNVPAGGSVVFSAPDGTLCNLHFGGCSGSVTFQGTNLEQSSALNGTIVVKGDTTTVSGIAVNNSSIGSSVVLRAKTPSKIPLGSFTSTGPVKSVTLEQMTLEGELDAPGISMLNLGSMQNANVQFAGYSGAEPMTITAGMVTDSTINSSVSFNSVNFASYTATTVGNLTAPGSSIITAPSIGTFHVGGTSSGDLNLTGGGSGDTLGRGMFGGHVSGRWNITGDSWYIGGNQFDNGWIATMDGSISSLKTTANFSGDLTASSIGTASIGGSLFGADIHLTASYSPSTFDLNKMTIGNSASSSSVWGPGSFNSIHMTYDVGSTFAAGIGDINTFNFAGDAGQYTSLSAGINSFSDICHTKGNYFESFVAGGYLGRINAGMVESSSSGIPFGINSGSTIEAETVVLPDGTASMHINVKNLNDTSSVPVTSPGDFETVINGVNVM